MIAAILLAGLSACGSSTEDPATGTGGTGGTAGAGISGGTAGGGSGGTSQGGSAGTSAGAAGTAGSTGAGTGGGAGSGGANGGGTAGASGSAGASGGTGGIDDGDCTTPPAPGPLLGWAAEGSGTTGGGNATPVVVTSADQLADQLEGSDARVIHVSGVLSGSFAIGSNKTVIGTCGAEIHGSIRINGSSNIILRNLKVVGNNCSDSPNDCSGGADAIGINGGAHHIWVDHLDVSDGSDGNLDITQGADFVTVSWTKFSYSSKRTDPEAGASGHRFSNLIGGSDTDPLDVGHLNVTWHHNWWADNVDQRMPRTRRGQIHVFNNLYTASGNSYCTNAGADAKLLVQNNLYIGVNNPLTISGNGNMLEEGNEFQNTSGTDSASGTGFEPPYDFSLDPTSGLQAAIQGGVGPKD